MTYWQFHQLWIVPPLLLALLWAWPELRRTGRPAWLGLLALCLLAFTYATPWDNYLVYRQVWNYGPDRVWGTLFYVPIEEYLFFVFQTLLSGSLLVALTRPSRWRELDAPARFPLAVVAPTLLATGAAALLLLQERSFYLGLILVWALPVLGLQWSCGGDLLLKRWRACYLTAFGVSAYLWIADAFALAQGVWSISPRYTLGWQVGNLPFEEMLFFAVTNLMVCQGLTLCLEPVMWRRAQGLWQRHQKRVAL
ncbi:MAG: lycopene cyclase domain-containing protein [Candidatus Sericytochromatia bacterium]